jgi:glycosyltransferase involved in cell wall biosynthesis
MRVAMVACSAPARTAVGNLLAEKVAFFVESGAEVRVFIENAADLHPQLHGHLERCPDVPTEGRAWDFLRQCDLVFFEFSQGFDLLGLLPLLVDEKPRLIATYYGISPPAGWPGPQRELLERGCRERGLLWCADAVIVHSRFTASELTEATSLPPAHLHQLTIPLDLPHWSQPSPGARALPSGGDRSRHIILYVGRLALNKRVPLLIEALAHLPNAEAWIVGNDSDIYADQARQARDLAGRLGASGRVRWLGDVADDALPSLYHQADVLVLPSIHEGLGIPVLEAQAAGLPVIAARAAALPETVADAGLTFRPDDVLDLVRQLRRVFVGRVCDSSHADGSQTRPTKRVALVAFRFGAGFVGGAETSLRHLGRALQRQGCDVEVFTTCTIRESDWKNDLPAGASSEDGFLVHRFPVDPHDRAHHDEAFRAILENNGDVPLSVETEYLTHSIQSSALMDVLQRRQRDFDAIITCPYLHGLTFRVVQVFPEKTLLLPCFHDEPAARLRSWIDVYGNAAGLLYHTPEEQEFAQTVLGLNHPGATLIGTCLPPVSPLPRDSGGEGPGVLASVEILGFRAGRLPPSPQPTPPGVPGGEGEGPKRTLVYCGRYSIQKNVPLLLEFARRYQTEHPNRFRWLFIGEGSVHLPRERWLTDLGRLSDDAKHRTLAQADALVQLSTQESLSLVILEAWQHGVPVMVHADAPVMVGQCTRSGGGVAVSGYDSFARTLDDLWAHPDDWRERGNQGQRYTKDNYLDADAFARRLLQALEHASLPLAEQMRRRGLARVQRWDRRPWRESFGQFIERTLDAPPRAPKRDCVLEPLLPAIGVSARQSSFLLPVRIHNRGNVPATPATRIEVVLQGERASAQALREVPLVDLILPGQSATVMAPIELPQKAGRFTLSLHIVGASVPATLPVEIGEGPHGSALAGGISPLLEAAQRTLAEAYTRQALPRDYLDVSEGRFASAKRWVKQKILNNFKRAYVDVISAQQSEVNRRLVESVQQLSECCRALDQTVRTLQERVTQLSSALAEASPIDRSAAPPQNDATDSVPMGGVYQSCPSDKG